MDRSADEQGAGHGKEKAQQVAQDGKTPTQRHCLQRQVGQAHGDPGHHQGGDGSQADTPLQQLSTQQITDQRMTGGDTAGSGAHQGVGHLVGAHQPGLQELGNELLKQARQ